MQEVLVIYVGLDFCRDVLCTSNYSDSFCITRKPQLHKEVDIF